jgi:hypothetical protein
MNPQTERDIHLIATPFRIVSDVLQMLAFIAVLPIVLIISVVYWLATGKPIMSPDELDFLKWACILLTPVWIMIGGIVVWKLATYKPQPKKPETKSPKYVDNYVFPAWHPLAGKKRSDYTATQIVDACDRVGFTEEMARAAFSNGTSASSPSVG